MSLPAMPWKPLGTYDCSACYGESRRLETDCPECGGTGWHPPERHYDESCSDCRRPLWLGGRGPQWFEHEANGEARCRFCLLQAIRGRKIIAMGCGLDHREDRIDLAAFVERKSHD